VTLPLKKILALAVSCAALYAAVLGGLAIAQDPAATETATASATPSPAETAVAGTPTPTASAGTPTSTPSSSPTQTATPTVSSTPFHTPASPTPYPSPVQTVVGTPTATATPGALGLDLSKGGKKRRKRGNGNTGTGAITDLGCLEDGKKSKKSKKVIGVVQDSTSTTASECDLLDSKAPHDPLEGDTPRATERPDGTPTPANPGYALATPGAAPIGVPNFFIDKFRIPPFLLPVYQAAGIEYGVRWEVLAAINEIETDYGRNLNVSSAGALGWMQFMPPTWKQYGVDANRDGMKDPYNPVDAIFAAARYLRAAGAETDIRRAIFAYNHADWYVDSVLMRARLIGGLPSNFVGSLTGLTQGRFPVHARAKYAGQVTHKGKKAKTGQNAALVVESEQERNGIKIYARRGAPVIAVNDGKIIRKGETERLGKFIQLQDSYGNTYTYGHLGKVADTYPAPKPRKTTKKQIAKELELPGADAKPEAAASETAEDESAVLARAGGPRKSRKVRKPRAKRTPTSAVLPAAAPTKQRLFASPSRPNSFKAGGAEQLGDSYQPADSAPIGLDARDFVKKPLKKGSRVVAGTILGRIGKVDPLKAPHVLFELRPAGRGAPRVDPKPILDGWKLLESTAIYRAKGKNPFFGDDSAKPTLGQILLMGKETLSRHVLANPRIDVYSCGARDIRSGAIDRRVLATLEFLAASGLKPTVTSLKCGHGFLTSSGNVSQHSSGNAVDIAMINGIPILGHQGKGSIADLTIQRLLTLQGTMKPDQIISLMTFEGADNTLAMADHADHIHVGWKPLYGTNSKAAKQVNAVLKPKQWIKLIDRLKDIDNPEVRLQPSKYSVKVVRNASDAHRGE
jgi:Transglycosylase SLT domain/Peptidase family M23